MKLLIGSTGTIGKTLKESISFDYEFNSSNIQELLTLDLKNQKVDIYLCCLPATKWKVNQDPISDFNNMVSIVEVLSAHNYSNIILYSTIDVYQDTYEGANEHTFPTIRSLNYGSIRFIFEEFIRNRLKYENLLILRLPGLYGKHIKKNIIYDILNNNALDKIVLNSKYQWYNLENLFNDTARELALTNYQKVVNLFPEPIETLELVTALKVDASSMDSNSVGAKYTYKSSHFENGYITAKTEVLNTIRDFIGTSKINEAKLKVAVCLFGEERDLAKRVEHWKEFNRKLNIDFYVALYSNDRIRDTLQLVLQELPVVDYEIAYNDLDKFDQVKYKAKNPIYIFKTDSKATFSRISSQLNIRQKAISLIKKDYDIIILCRTDVSEFNISPNDIWNVYVDKKLLVVSSEDSHKHPGGGKGCVECTQGKKCKSQYHANDICDLWCMGSSKAMKPWSTVYDTAVNTYAKIQSLSDPLDSFEDIEGFSVWENLNENEIHITTPQEHICIENKIHCYYPEKLMRVLFEDNTVVGASNSNYFWK